MHNSFDFYVVEIRSQRKTSIYSAMGGKDKVNKNRLSSRRTGFKNGYPVVEHVYVIRNVDIHGIDAQDASDIAEKTARQFDGVADIKARVRYVCRD